MTKVCSPIYQTDRYLTSEINRFGCYEMCLIFLGLGHRWSIDQDKIMLLHEHFTDEGMMNDECYVVNPQGIVNYVSATYGNGDQFKFVGKLYGNDIGAFNLGEGNNLIQKYRLPLPTGKHWDHFVIDHKDGTIFYDPWIYENLRISRTRRKGTIRSARGFTRVA